MYKRQARESLLPWQKLEEPLDIDSTEHVELTLGTLPAVAALDEVKGALAEHAPASEVIEISTNKELHYVLLLSLKDEHGKTMEALKPYNFSVVKSCV